MNICLISQEYPPETNWGGIATYTRVLAKRLADMGNKVHVVSMAVKEESMKYDGAVTVHRVGKRPKTQWAYRLNSRYFQFQPILNFSFRVAEKITEIQKDEPLDIIESPETCAQAVVIALRHRDIPVVTRLHTPHFWVRELNGTVMTPQFRRRDFLERLQARCSRGVSSPTHVMAEIVRKKWRVNKIDIIPNFFDLEEYTPDGSVYEKHLKGLDYILFFGRLEVRKGPQILSQAIPGILKKYPGLTIAFAGADLPYQKSTMRQYIQGNNKAYVERLIFLDNMPHEQLYPVIEKSRLVVLPSLWENFPYACLEAMSFEKVVIATTGSGFEEIIENGSSGILVSPDKPEALAGAVTEALRHKNLMAIGQEARRRASQFHSSRIVPRMLEYYAQIAGERR